MHVCVCDCWLVIRPQQKQRFPLFLFPIDSTEPPLASVYMVKPNWTHLCCSAQKQPELRGELKWIEASCAETGRAFLLSECTVPHMHQHYFIITCLTFLQAKVSWAFLTRGKVFLWAGNPTRYTVHLEQSKLKTMWNYEHEIASFMQLRIIFAFMCVWKWFLVDLQNMRDISKFKRKVY